MSNASDVSVCQRWLWPDRSDRHEINQRYASLVQLFSCTVPSFADAGMYSSVVSDYCVRCDHEQQCVQSCRVEEFFQTPTQLLASGYQKIRHPREHYRSANFLPLPFDCLLMGTAAMRHLLVEAPAALAVGCVHLLFALNVAGLTAFQYRCQNDRDGLKITVHVVDYMES